MTQEERWMMRYNEVVSFLRLIIGIRHNSFQKKS